MVDNKTTENKLHFVDQQAIVAKVAGISSKKELKLIGKMSEVFDFNVEVVCCIFY